MAKKRKSVATSLDEVDRTMYSNFSSAANSLSHLYSQAITQQKLSFLSGERHALVSSYSFHHSNLSLFSNFGVNEICSLFVGIKLHFNLGQVL